MPIGVHIKHFDDKFRYLFSGHPSIHNYTNLAEALDVAVSLIAGWKNGTPYTPPEHIPIKHIGRVCDHLFVAQEALELEDLQQFKTRAADRPRPSAWDALVLSAPFSPRMQIASAGQISENPAALLATTRGMYDPDDLEEDVPVFKGGESVVVRLDSEPGWHVALLLKDRVGWQRLHPTTRRPETRTDGTFYYPLRDDPRCPRFARLDAVPGTQVLVAVLTEKPIPEHLRQAIADSSELPSALQRLSAHLGAATTPVSEIVQLRYHVGP